jgi:hypothetical protein
MTHGGDVMERPQADGAPRQPSSSRAPPPAGPPPVPESARLTKRDAGRRAFGPKRLRTVEAIAEALFADEDERGLRAPPGDLVGRVAGEFDLWVGAGSPDLHRGYRFVLWLIEWLPLVVMGTFSRASRLPLSRRLGYLERLEQARFALLATIVVAFKVPMTMLAFELDPELRITGFDRSTVSSPRTSRARLKVQAG